MGQHVADVRTIAGVEGVEVTEEPFRLDRATFDAMVEHAWSDFPYEVCGLLGVRPDGSLAHWEIANDERSMTYYRMNGKEQLHAMREIEDNGWGLAIYHSHTHTEAYPSRTDVELAVYPEATYLIVSLQDRDHPQVRGFHIDDGEVSEIPVDITP